MLRVLNFIACGLMASDGVSTETETDPVSLLQTAAVHFHKHGRHNATQHPEDHGLQERKLCSYDQESHLAMVTKNNLCGYDGAGPRELRYRNVMKVNEVDIDLVVKPTGEFKCTNKVTNDRNGREGAKFGAIVIPVGTEAEFSFSFVKTETDDLANVDELPFSFVDLDQGKKGKQRESVEVCGVTNAVVKLNTELEKSVSGDCIKVTSTTRGNNRDNPFGPDHMIAQAQARSIAFQTAGASFNAKLGVSKSGRRSRKIMFIGHPTIACADEIEIELKKPPTTTITTTVSSLNKASMICEPKCNLGKFCCFVPTTTISNVTITLKGFQDACETTPEGSNPCYEPAGGGQFWVRDTKIGEGGEPGEWQAWSNPQESARCFGLGGFYCDGASNVHEE